MKQRDRTCQGCDEHGTFFRNGFRWSCPCPKGDTPRKGWVTAYEAAAAKREKREPNAFRLRTWGWDDEDTSTTTTPPVITGRDRAAGERDDA